MQLAARHLRRCPPRSRDRCSRRPCPVRRAGLRACPPHVRATSIQRVMAAAPTDQSARITAPAGRLPETRRPWQVKTRMSEPPHPPSPAVGPHDITDLDVHLFCEGTHARMYEKLGAHLTRQGG